MDTLEITMDDFRVYLIAKINSVKMDLYFERRPDGYVKEREIRFEGDYSILGSKRFNRSTITYDAGGAVTIRPDVSTKKQ